MARPVNPYVAGAPLRGEQGVFGRKELLDWVTRELRNPATNALVLMGQRRTGKTTMLLQLERTLPADCFLPVYFDLQDQATCSLGQVLADLADTIAEKAGIEALDPAVFDDRGLSFRRVFLARLYDVLGENKRPVLLMDEFDVLDQAAEAELPRDTAAKALFPFLRRLMAEDSRLAFVFVVGRRAEDLSLDFTSTFKASLKEDVWVLSRASTEALVRQAEVDGTLSFTEQAVARIWSLTNGHPYLTQLLCQRIWERAYSGNPTKPPKIDVTDVDNAVSNALDAAEQALVWLWNGLSPAEKIYAAALAEVAGEGETIAEERVVQVLTSHASRLRRGQVELAPRDLRKRQVLEMAGEREYRFAVELFRRWVSRHKPLRQVKDELDRIEPLAEQFFSMGQSFFYRGKWESAVQVFQQALQLNPDHFRARLRLGETLLEMGQTEDAIVELERAYDLDPEEARLPLVRAAMLKARAQEVAGNEDGALATCQRVLAISADERVAREMQTAIWTRRGEAALEEDALDAALAAFQKVGDEERIAQVRTMIQWRDKHLLPIIDKVIRVQRSLVDVVGYAEALKSVGFLDALTETMSRRSGLSKLVQLEQLSEELLVSLENIPGVPKLQRLPREPSAPGERTAVHTQPPLGQFITTYEHGENTYDESFSIETPFGDFMGEVGASITEVIGSAEVDQVVAFEVWLFDKSDLKTLVYILMCPSAFRDSSLRAEVARKGEPVLASAGQSFTMETPTLRVVVTVRELALETISSSQDFFRKITLDLVATGR